MSRVWGGTGDLWRPGSYVVKDTERKGGRTTCGLHDKGTGLYRNDINTFVLEDRLRVAGVSEKKQGHHNVPSQWVTIDDNTVGLTEGCEGKAGRTVGVLSSHSNRKASSPFSKVLQFSVRPVHLSCTWTPDLSTRPKL